MKLLCAVNLAAADFPFRHSAGEPESRFSGWADFGDATAAALE